MLRSRCMTISCFLAGLERTATFFAARNRTSDFLAAI